MSIGQFLTIFWARRMFILAATASCLAGALIVCAVLPPRWESTARVMLDTIKPDPVTGLVINGTASHAYVVTQTDLITDYTVAGKVAEHLGWLTDPTLIAAYRSRPANDERDFRRWLADLVIQNTKAVVIEGSNILEITYTATTAAGAKAVAEALRRAYMDTSLDFRHEDAERNAVWYTEQMAKTKEGLDQAVAAETAFEKANGLVMQSNKLDAESARLQALTQEGAPLSTPVAPTADTSPAAVQLAGVEGDLVVARKTMGPNNPQVQDLEARRAALASLVERDKANASNAAAHLAAGGVAALNRAVSDQKAKVVGQSEQIGKLNELHQDVELRQDEYQRVSAKAAEFREEANAADVGLTSLGPASTPQAPTFPNYWLVIPGAIVLGLVLGVLISLLMEIIGHRVRGPEDLALDIDAPVICVIPAPDISRGAGRRRPSRPAGWQANQGALGA